MRTSTTERIALNLVSAVEKIEATKTLAQNLFENRHAFCKIKPQTFSFDIKDALTGEIIKAGEIVKEVVLPYENGSNCASRVSVASYKLYVKSLKTGVVIFAK